MAKRRFIYRIGEGSSMELRQAHERLLIRWQKTGSTFDSLLTKCINEYVDSPLRRIEDLESALGLSETLRRVERTTAQSDVAKLEARVRNLTESLDLANGQLERTDSVSVVAHKQGATSADKPPSVH